MYLIPSNHLHSQVVCRIDVLNEMYGRSSGTKTSTGSVHLIGTSLRFPSWIIQSFYICPICTTLLDASSASTPPQVPHTRHSLLSSRPPFGTYPSKHSKTIHNRHAQLGPRRPPARAPQSGGRRLDLPASAPLAARAQQAASDLVPPSFSFFWCCCIVIPVIVVESWRGRSQADHHCRDDRGDEGMRDESSADVLSPAFFFDLELDLGCRRRRGT